MLAGIRICFICRLDAGVRRDESTVRMNIRDSVSITNLGWTLNVHNTHLHWMEYRWPVILGEENIIMHSKPFY